MTKTRTTTRWLASIGALALVTTAGLQVAFASSDTDDQAVAEAAISAFNERMADAGFVSDGPRGESDEPDPEEQEFLESECMQNTGLTAPSGPDVPGQTARALSDGVEFDLEATTESTDDRADTIGAYTFALVVTVDTDHRDDLDAYFEYLASEARLRCLREFQLAQSTAPVPEPEFEFSVEPDLHIGDRSGRIDISMTATRLDKVFTIELSILVARSDRSLVMLNFATSPGDPIVDIDLEAELETLVDSL